MKKKIIVLGSTGSIGKNTLDIVRTRKDEFAVAALSAHSNIDELEKQVREFAVDKWSLSGSIGSGRNPSPYPGKEGLLRMIEETEASLLVNGIAGAEGLEPSVTALTSGKNLALANKETIVMAGPLIMALAKEENRAILPVDSEHSAVFHLLRHRPSEDVTRIILTASGGAFRDLPLEELSKVTPEDALKHPTWKMGAKITVDSATMANKGLEVIEAKELFGFPLSSIDVVIHPQSLVHSLIQTRDGSLYAQISKPDMRLPIQNALTYPELGDSDFAVPDLTDATITFTAPCKNRYPLLELGRNAARAGGEYQVVFNAANEVAVEAFLRKRIGFIRVSEIVEETLAIGWENLLTSFEQIREIDKKARDFAKKVVY